MLGMDMCVSVLTRGRLVPVLSMATTSKCCMVQVRRMEGRKYEQTYILYVTPLPRTTSGIVKGHKRHVFLKGCLIC